MVQRIGYGENAMFFVIIMKHALQIMNCRLGIIYHRFRTEVSLLANKENCKISKANLTILSRGVLPATRSLFFWHLDFGWHRFCFSPCWMRTRIIKAQAILALLDSFQELHLEIW